MIMKFGDFIKKCQEIGVNNDTEICYENMNFGGNDGELDIDDIKYFPQENELRVSSKFFPELD